MVAAAAGAITQNLYVSKVSIVRAEDVTNEVGQSGVKSDVSMYQWTSFSDRRQTPPLEVIPQKQV